MFKRTQLRYLAVATASALTVLLMATGGIFWASRSPIPASIRQATTFAVLYPTRASDVTIEPKTFKYSSSLKQVSFVTKYAGRSVTFAEQTAPDQFGDIPDYYQKFVEKMNSYASFDSISGKVDLTRPTQTKQQVAVMNTKGTLLFAQSDGDLSETQWHHLMGTLATLQPH